MRKTRITGALIAAAAMLLLSGCVRFQVNLTVTPENMLNGDIIVATMIADSESESSKSDAIDAAEDIEKEYFPNLSDADGVTRVAYEEDGYAGMRFTLKNTPIAAISSESGALKLTRDGETFVFDGALDFTPGMDDAPDEDADTKEIQVSITFPGAVTDHNGTLDNTRVTWNMAYEGSLEMHAVAGAQGSGGSNVSGQILLWVLVGVGGLVLIGIIVVLVKVLKKRPIGTPPAGLIDAPVIAPVAAPVAEPASDTAPGVDSTEV